MLEDVGDIFLILLTYTIFHHTNKFSGIWGGGGLSNYRPLGTHARVISCGQLAVLYPIPD